MELLYQQRHEKLANMIAEDIRMVSPDTEVVLHLYEMDNPWDFQEVYGVLHDFAKNYKFDRANEEYLLHITTGTHVAQICSFLLTEANYIPARLLQTGPPKRDRDEAGSYQVIDLDLSKYDLLASRFAQEHQEGTSYLKGGIETKNKKFNAMIAQLEKISVRSPAPILLTGPTGAGKTQLASRLYDLKLARGQITGPLVIVNCATLRGDNAMSALFGHKKGAFTGAAANRPGLLAESNNGLLFLDEIGELGLDEQAMLLRAVENKQFLPVGSDKEVSSDFQIIAGTSKDLLASVQKGDFREDLLARINLWSYRIPSLKERPEDIEPNLSYELERYAQQNNVKVTFNKEAHKAYMQFALSADAHWAANFRDLNASVTRMATLCEGGRINKALVELEQACLLANWGQTTKKQSGQRISQLMTAEAAEQLDDFDRIQLEGVLEIVQQHSSLASAGRALFQVSRTQKKQTNDSHRLRSYLNKFGISSEDIKRLKA